jgi:hypothetical protein
MHAGAVVCDAVSILYPLCGMRTRRTRWRDKLPLREMPSDARYGPWALDVFHLSIRHSTRTQVWSARNPRNRFNTKVMKKNTNPMWNSKVFTFPRGESQLCLQVQDKDFFKTDHMGVAEVSLKDLEVGKPRAIWVPLEVKRTEHTAPWRCKEPCQAAHASPAKALLCLHCGESEAAASRWRVAFSDALRPYTRAERADRASSRATAPTSRALSVLGAPHQTAGVGGAVCVSSRRKTTTRGGLWPSCAT